MIIDKILDLKTNPESFGDFHDGHYIYEEATDTTRKIVLEDKSGNKFEIEYKSYGNIGKIYDGKILNCSNKFNAKMLFLNWENIIKNGVVTKDNDYFVWNQTNNTDPYWAERLDMDKIEFDDEEIRIKSIRSTGAYLKIPLNEKSKKTVKELS